jgi:hypothetical protein
MSAGSGIDGSPVPAQRFERLGDEVLCRCVFKGKPQRGIFRSTDHPEFEVVGDEFFEFVDDLERIAQATPVPAC